MLDSVFVMPPLFDDSYYGFPIHEIREMQIMNMDSTRMATSRFSIWSTYIITLPSLGRRNIGRGR